MDELKTRKVVEKIPLTWEKRLNYPEEVLKIEGFFEEFLAVIE